MQRQRPVSYDVGMLGDIWDMHAVGVSQSYIDQLRRYNVSYWTVSSIWALIFEDTYFVFSSDFYTNAITVVTAASFAGLATTLQWL